MRVQPAQAFGGRFDLGPAHLGGGKGDLALQVRQTHHVVVDQTQRPDAGCRQIEGRRRAHAAGPDDQHPRTLQGLLARPPDLGQDQMPGVAFDFVFRENHALL